MKRILRVFILCLISIPTFCFAAGRNVTFDATFDGVDANLINNMYVYYTDKSETEYSVTLRKEDNYYYSYDLYSGSDILRVNVIFDQNDFLGESSIVKTDNGYNIHINVKPKNNTGIIIDNTPTTSVTTTSPTTVVDGQTTTTIKSQTTSSVQNETTTSKTEEEKQTQIIKNVYFFILIVLGIVALIFLGYATIKIVNANK